MALRFNTIMRALLAGGGARNRPVSFNVNLSNPSGATITTGVGTVTINNYVPTTITSEITPARVSGVAPLSVFFDATASTAAAVTSKPFHELGYSWDFGDPAGGATWAVGARSGRSKNTAIGAVANHVFETPGTYTVTLVNTYVPLTGGVSTSYKTVTITVQDPDVVFASNTIYFSDSADFGSTPVGAVKVTTTDFAAAINTYQSTYKRLLFKRGGVFSTSTVQATITQNGAGIIGAYGTGAAPIFRTTGAAFFKLSSAYTAGIGDWRVMDIEVDGQSGSAYVSNADGGMNQLLFLRVNAHDVATGYNFSEDLLSYWNADVNPAKNGHTLWDQLAIVDCTVQRVMNAVPTGGRIGIFASATRHALMGSVIDPETGGEHAVRYPYLSRAVVQNNNLLGPAPTKHALTIRGADQAKTGALVGVGMQSEFVVVSGNTLQSDQADWTMTVAPTNTSLDERISDVVVESNYFHGSNMDYALVTRGCVKRLTVRNNIANVSGGSAWAGAFAASGSTSAGAPQSEDFVAYSNTVYRSDACTALVVVALGANAKNYSISNTLVYAPNATTVTIASGAIDSGLVVGLNSSESQAKSTSPLFTSLPSALANQLSATDFVPGSGSYAKDAGQYAPVFFDFANATRTGTFDLGAFSL